MPITNLACECEHAAHFSDTGEQTPNGNPGHEYGARFAQRREVPTAWGTFFVCYDCAKDCLA